MNKNHPLAIVGMSCYLPHAKGIDEFWKLLLENRNAVSCIPPSRFDRELYFDETKGLRGKSYIDQAGLVDYPSFDQSLCNYPTHVMNYIEVGHLMMTQVAARACRDANMNPFDLPLKNTGVYVGNNQAGHQAGNLTYSMIVEEAAHYLNGLDVFRNATGNIAGQVIDEVVRDIRKELPCYGHNGFPTVGYHVTANAVSNALHLTGPSFVLDAACSSSLKALSLAAQDIQLGKIDMAIVGGASFFTTDSLLLFSAAQSGSANGCFPFSEKADGLISAEGYVAVVVKSLDRALADGDPIRVIVTSIGVSSDGRGKSLWAPRKEGQVEAIRRAYRTAEEMRRLDYIEAHATSTALGDQTELEAMEEAFRGCFSTKIPVGGVKANIGHALEAAGLAGLVKTALVLQHKVVPKQINSLPLNSRIDWEALPFYVPQENIPLPKRSDGQMHRAAVNSFGIGGLNVHIVMEDFNKTAAKTTVAVRQPLQSVGEPIAVVGVGTVFPGARTAEAFLQLMFSDTDPSSEVTNRWNAAIGYTPERTNCWSSIGQRGGFLTDFEYDWKRHRIAPKHIAMADPLQFMILDSVDTALVDAGYVADPTSQGPAKPFPYKTTGVIVGSTFDTDFATDLCMGFRLPHFQRELRRVLRQNGCVDDMQIQEILDVFSRELLAKMPAILDETGSFTPSTLSSRITKTYDLMGGAGTICSGDTVGLAALDQAVNSLRTGACDMMICSVGARMMGLQTFVRMRLADQLAAKGKRNLLDKTAEGQIPGEGAGTLILKRLSDAERDGDQIHFLVHGIGCGYDPDPETAFNQAIERAWDATDCSKNELYLIEGSTAPADKVAAELSAFEHAYGSEISQRKLLLDRADARLGHTQGASAMASLLKANCVLEKLEISPSFEYESPTDAVSRRADFLTVPKQTVRLPIVPSTDNASPRVLAAVSSWDPCGSAYHAIMERGTRIPLEQPVAKTNIVQNVAVQMPMRIVRLQADSQAALMERIEYSLRHYDELFEKSDSLFRTESSYRLAVVTSNPEGLRTKLELAGKFAFQSQDLLLSQKGIFVGSPFKTCQVTFLFPGQGSQYPGMLKSVVETFSPARKALQEINNDLISLGFPTFETLAWDEAEQLGADVFRTQLSILCADTILCRCLTGLGIKPDVVSGHSYGEFPALVASGAWSFHEGIRATKARCDAIISCKTAQGMMLSTNWDADRAAEACRRIKSPAFVANINAPDQTVIGGTHQAAAELEEYIKSQGGMALAIPVPRPFHTPLMNEVRQPLFDALGAIETNIPMVAMFSSVENDYVSDPRAIRRNLADQMTEPVRYIDLILRLKAEGVNFFVECGPNQILTRLHRKILGDTPVAIIASDAKDDKGAYQLYCVKACMEVFSSRETTVGDANDCSNWAVKNRDVIVCRSQRLADAGGLTTPTVSLSDDEKQAAAQISDVTGLLPMTVEVLLKSEGGLKRFRENVDASSSSLAFDIVTQLQQNARDKMGWGGNLGCFSSGNEMTADKNATSIGARTLKPISEKPIQPISRRDFEQARRTVNGGSPVKVVGDEYSRFTLQVMSQPLTPAERKPIQWNGRVLILGQNTVSLALADLVRKYGGDPVLLSNEKTREELLAEIDSHWKQGALPHLYLTTAHDADAVTDLADANWNRRRERGVYVPFFVTQQWFRLLANDRLVAKGTFCGSSVLGGDFGFCGNIRGIEGGALAGLVKSMDLEAGFPTNFAFVAKTVDFSGHETMEFRALAMFNEMAAKIPYETEIGYVGEQRLLVRPIVQQADVSAPTGATPTGNWIVTGGGRGITALIAERLATKFGLKLFLLGSSPEPDVDPAWYDLDADGKDAFKQRLQTQSKADGGSFPDVWKRFERAAELGSTIHTMRRAGIDVRYRPCDVSDREQVRRTLDRIRRESGPISGILHGAGIEVSSRMETKDPNIVEKTFAVKCDGAAALMECTKDDPVRHFIGFGSIAGRMGSIGQADYSMANDALAKLCDWYQASRPECRVTCFHWGPWGEIGMAARPEMQSNPILATMRLLKPEEGLRHFMNELATGRRTTETLLIDWEHYKLYYPDKSSSEPVEATSVHSEEKQKPETAEQQHTPIRRMIVRWVEEQPESTTEELTFDYTVLVYGRNADADQLTATLTGCGVNVLQADAEEDEKRLLDRLDEIWNEHGPVSHLFLMSGRDAKPQQLSDISAWKRRRKVGFYTPFYLLRHWLRKLTEANLLDRAAVVAATSMNGDAGIESGTAALECSGIAGLLKTIHLELGGENRSGITVRVVDFPAEEPSETVVSGLLYELTTQGFDIETAYVRGTRRVPRLVEQHAKPVGDHGIKRGSTWVITGGARGITARVALALGKRFGLKLQLLGSTASDAVDPAVYNLSEAELKAKKREVVKQAIADGKSPEKEWGRIQNALEMNRNLREMQNAGIDFAYRQCDVTDPAQVERVFAEIAGSEGPIVGIVHGAGIDGNPATIRDMLDKQFEVSDKLVAIKVDAVLEMLRHTDPDQLRYFVGFGSISGRFGAASASSYCSGNDMLCKIMGQLRNERPRCRAVGIHWHAWGEVGMMTRPVSYGSVKVLKMQLMAPDDGIRHLIRELEAGLPENEIVVTDSQYYSLFHSDRMLIDNSARCLAGLPPASDATLLRPMKAAVPLHNSPMIERVGDGVGECTFYPATDPFLFDHRFRGRPFLPAVIGMETFMETVEQLYPNQKIAALHDLEFCEGLRFPTDDPFSAKVCTEKNGQQVSCRLIAPFYNAAGKLMSSERMYSRCTVELGDPMPLGGTLPEPPSGKWYRINYIGPEALMYHGPVFQQSREALFSDDSGVWSKITAFPLAEFGGQRGDQGWILHPGTVDACLYVCGVCVWLESKGAIGLPKSLGTLRMVRCPQSGEQCMAHTMYRGGDESEAFFDVVCYGENGRPLFALEKYCCRVVPTSVKK